MTQSLPDLDFIQEFLEEEKSCGPLCQHPQCWSSDRRKNRGLPHMTMRVQSAKQDYEELPTMNVVNMLDDYGADPRDRYPAQWDGKPLHKRAHSLPMLKHFKRGKGYPETKTPHGTPATQTPQRSTADMGQHGGKGKTAPSILGQVEVQEVFDVKDLKARLKETFVTKPVYVWMPKPGGHQRSKTDPFNGMSITKLSQGPSVLPARDVTEDLIPRGIEQKRKSSLKKSSRPKSRSSTSRNGKPYRKKVLISPAESDALYEMLDVPHSIMEKIIERAEQSDLISREKIREMLARIWPEVEEEYLSTAVLGREVLRQQKVKLLDSKLRQQQLRKTAEPLTQKQVYFLDDVEQDVEEGPCASHVKEDVKDGEQDEVEGVDENPTGQASSQTPLSESQSPPLNKKKPLPSIGSTDSSPTKSKIPTISLGLPWLPTGTTDVKPFNYKQTQDVDFTLGHIATPPTLSTTSEVPDTYVDKYSTIHVTVPSIPSEREDPLEQSSRYRAAGKSSSGGGVPKTPTCTPATPVHHQRWTSSPRKGVRTVPITEYSMYGWADSPCMYPHPPVNTPNTPKTGQSAGLNSDQGFLDPIQESERLTGSPDGRLSSAVGETRRDKYSLLDRGGDLCVPPNPPSTPQDEREASGTITLTPSPPPLDKLLQSVDVTGEENAGACGSKKEENRELTPGITPEPPWPEIDEKEYKELEEKLSKELPKLKDEIERYNAATEGARRGSLNRQLMNGATVAPAPPPPSPDPTEAPPSGGNQNLRRDRKKERNKKASLEEIVEGQSEVTVSIQQGSQQGALRPETLGGNEAISNPVCSTPGRSSQHTEHIKFELTGSDSKTQENTRIDADGTLGTSSSSGPGQQGFRESSDGSHESRETHRNAEPSEAHSGKSTRSIIRHSTPERGRSESSGRSEKKVQFSSDLTQGAAEQLDALEDDGEEKLYKDELRAEYDKLSLPRDDPLDPNDDPSDPNDDPSDAKE